MIERSPLAPEAMDSFITVLFLILLAIAFAMLPVLIVTSLDKPVIDVLAIVAFLFMAPVAGWFIGMWIAPRDDADCAD